MTTLVFYRSPGKTASIAQNVVPRVGDFVTVDAIDENAVWEVIELHWIIAKSGVQTAVATLAWQRTFIKS